MSLTTTAGFGRSGSTPPRTGPQDGGEWEVYGADGTLLATVMLPIRSTPSPRFADGRMVGVVEDELGVPFVVVLEVEER